MGSSHSTKHRMKARHVAGMTMGLMGLMFDSPNFSPQYKLFATMSTWGNSAANAMIPSGCQASAFKKNGFYRSS